MSDPTALDVLEALQVRLQAINPGDGYNTDAGARVFLGKRRANPDQIDIGPTINVYDTEDEPDETTAWGDEPIHTTLRINVDAFIRDVSGEGTRLAHLVIQDIFNAALSAQTIGGSLDLGYAGRSIEYPEPGGDTIAVSLEFTSVIQLPYGNI